MGENIAARAATSLELGMQRTNNQWSKLRLAVQPVNVVYTARINQSFTSLDGVTQLTIDGGSGVIADVLPNMTIFVGSSAGAYDIGYCRVRKTSTNTLLYISPTSDIVFDDNQYLTIVDAMPLWTKIPSNDGGVIRVDYDIARGEVYEHPPVPVLGPIAAVVRLQDGTVDFTPPSPAESYSLNDAEIDAVLFSAPGASATQDMDTVAPIFTYDTPGCYRWSCTVTDDQGLSATGYRWVFVEPESPEFKISSEPACNVSDGGWSFGVSGLRGVTLEDVRPMAMAVLWSEDFYGNEAGGIGPIEGYENVLAVGWVDGETIQYNPIHGSVDFTVSGPAAWMSKIDAVPFALTDTSSNAETWGEVKELTVDKALFRLLYWYSNAMQIMDCVLTGDEKRLPEMTFPAGDLLTQINSAAGKLFAGALVNRFGQLFVQTDSQFMPVAARDAIPVIQEITKKDWLREITFQRRDAAELSFVELAGETYDGSTVTEVFSHAPGTLAKLHGDMENPQGHLFADQDDCNRLAGCRLAVGNNPYPAVEIHLGSNHRLVDICPLQYLTLSLSAEDTQRGIAFTDLRLIPRRISLDLGGQSGAITFKVIFEAEVIGEHGVTYIPPKPPEYNLSLAMPRLSFADFPNLGGFPAFITVGDLTSCDADVPTGPYSLQWSRTTLWGSAPAAQRVAEAYFPCTIRPNSFVHDSVLDLKARFYNDAYNHCAVTAFREGADVLSISKDGGVISGASAVSVDGFRVTIEAGNSDGDGKYMFQEEAPTFTIGSAVGNSGNMAHPSEVKTISGLTPGNWYMMTSNLNVNIAVEVWFVNGIGPMGRGKNPEFPGDFQWDGFPYYDTRPEASYSSADQIGGVHFNDYRLYFRAQGTSVQVNIWLVPTFGTVRLDVWNATIVQPRLITLANSILTNVCEQT